MASGKEKIKLNKILSSLAEVQKYDVSSLHLVNDGVIEYTKVIRTLYKNSPNVFANLYNYDLAEIRSRKRNLKEDFSDQQQQANFIAYRDSLRNATESAVEYITEYIEL